jgi:hypothetical protein
MFPVASYETDSKDTGTTLYFAQEALRLTSMDVASFVVGIFSGLLSWRALSLRADVSDIGCVTMET